MSNSGFPTWAMRRARNQALAHPLGGQLCFFGSCLWVLSLTLLALPCTLAFLLIGGQGTIAELGQAPKALVHALVHHWNLSLPKERQAWLIETGIDPERANTLSFLTANEDKSTLPLLWPAMVKDYGSIWFSDSRLKELKPGLDMGFGGVAFSMAAMKHGFLARAAHLMAYLPGSHLSPNALGWIGLFSAVLWALATLGLFILGQGALRAAAEGGSRLRQAIYAQVHGLERMRALPRATEEVSSLLTNQLPSLVGFLEKDLADRYRYFFLAFGLFLGALLIQPAVALALAGLLILGDAAGRSIRELTSPGYRENDTRARLLGSFLGQNLLPIRLIKTYGLDVENQSINEHVVDLISSSEKKRGWSELVGELSIWMFVFLLIIPGAWFVWFQCAQSMVEWALVWATLTLLICSYESMRIGRAHHSHSESASSDASSLFEFLDERDSPQRPGILPVNPISEKVELDDVLFKDQSTGKRLLNGVTISIAAGTKVGIVSSDPREVQAVFSLLLRLAEPTAGDVRLDRINIRSARAEDVRTQVALISEEDGLIPDSINSNLEVGGREITAGERLAAARLAHLDRFVRDLPDQYQTVVHIDGSPLRPFPAHLLGVARAILAQPSLVLWEEPNYPLSSDEKFLLEDTCRRWLEGKTVVYLPRRATTLKNCDKVFFLEKGRLEALGSHRELFEGNTAYRQTILRILPLASDA